MFPSDQLTAACSSRSALAVLVGRLDPDSIMPGEAEPLWEAFDAMVRLATSARTLVARKVEEGTSWKRSGSRSPAEHLARKAGTSTGAARSELETSNRLRALPGTESALRRGELSGPQAAAVADGATADRGAEHKLLCKAKTASLAELRDESARVKAAADPDPDARWRRLHAERRLRRFVDGEGAWNLTARGTVDAGSYFNAALDPIIDEMFTTARRQGRREPREAYAFDALIELALRCTAGEGDAGGPAGDAPPAGASVRHGGDNGSGAGNGEGGAGGAGAGNGEGANRNGHGMGGSGGAGAGDGGGGGGGGGGQDGEGGGGGGGRNGEGGGGGGGQDGEGGSGGPGAGQGEGGVAARCGEGGDSNTSGGHAGDEGQHGGSGESGGGDDGGFWPGVSSVYPGGGQDGMGTDRCNANGSGAGHDVGHGSGIGTDLVARGNGSGGQGASLGASSGSGAPSGGGAADAGGLSGRLNGRSAAPGRNPTHMALLRLDVEALLRGRAEGDELCEISGLGPVPVRIARQLLGDAVLKLVLTRGVDVANVTHLGRGPSAAQRAAMLWSSPTCVVQGCNNVRTEADHRVPYAQTHHTRLDELDGVCNHHHDLKTYEGWALVAGSGRRPVVAPDDPRHPAFDPSGDAERAPAEPAKPGASERAPPAGENPSPAPRLFGP